MIEKLKNWIGKVARQAVTVEQPVPSAISHNAPLIQVFKITNGYLVTKHDNGPYIEKENRGAVYCATPMEVANLILKGEVMDKMGFDVKEQALHTHGAASAKFNPPNVTLPI